MFFKSKGYWIKMRDDEFKCTKCKNLVRDAYEPTITNITYKYCPICGNKKYKIKRRKKE